jgi:hypothetical protein
MFGFGLEMNAYPVMVFCMNWKHPEYEMYFG